MENPFSEYLVAATAHDDGSWAYEDGNETSLSPDALRAVHFHTAELTDAQRDHLCSLPKLEALTFCEDYEHSEASLARISEVVEAKEIRDLDFERAAHFPWLKHFPNTTRVRTHAGRSIGPEGLEPLLGLAKLEELSLVDTQLTDASLAPLSGLTSLRTLDVGANPELTTLGDLRGLSQLETLEAVGVPKLEDLSGLAGLPALRRLMIPHSRVRDLSSLARLPALETIDLMGCPIDDAQLTHLATCPALKAVNLRGCPVSDAGLAVLEGRDYEAIDVLGTRASRAQILRLLGGEPTRGVFSPDAELASERDADGVWEWKEAADWSGEPSLGAIRAVRLAHCFAMEPGTLGFLPLVPQLESLDLTGTSTLSPSDYQSLVGVTGLKELILCGAEFSTAEDPEASDLLGDTQIAELAAANPELETLDVGNTEASEGAVRAFARLTRLEALSLAGRPAAIGALENLRELPLKALNLQETALGPPQLKALAQGFRSLEALDLRGNRELTHLGGLVGLAALNELNAGASGVLDLSGLTSLSALRTLTLDHTPLAELGPLSGHTQLTHLKLDATQVDDRAAGVLETLKGLSLLNLSNTHVGDACVQALAKASPPLRTLSLASTRISDLSIPLLLGLEGLEALDVSGVWLSGESLELLEAAKAVIPTLAYSRPGDDNRNDVAEREPFAGLPLAKFDGALHGDVGAHAWLLTTPAWDPAFPLLSYARRLLDDPRVSEVKALVIGSWENPAEGPCVDALEALVAGASKLESLEALFLGAMEAEECEVSWIQHTDLSALLASFPRLRTFKVRGSDGLSFEAGVTHEQLRSLSIECGGLPGSVLNAILSGQLPNLETLDLCLGTENYGWDADLDDLLPLLSGKLFPKLVNLGLKDSEHQDEVAARIAGAPLLQRLKTLDLSLGTLTDEGANALLASDAIRGLKRLTIHHHFLSPEACKKLEALPCEVSLADPQEAEDWGGGELYRYVAIGE